MENRQKTTGTVQDVHNHLIKNADDGDEVISGTDADEDKKDEVTLFQITLRQHYTMT
jgi:hypothetical protein